MRVSLWVGLVQACRENLRRQQTRVRLFEIGKKFQLQGAEQSGELREIETLAGIATGARWPEQWGSAREALDFYDVKADVQSVLALTGDAAGVRFEAQALGCLRPGRSAQNLSWRGCGRLAGRTSSASGKGAEFVRYRIFV